MDTTTIIYLIIIGFVAGGIAKFLLPGKDPGGWIITILLGIGGAFLGSYIDENFISLSFTGTALYDRIISAVIGSLVLLIAFRLVFGRKKR